MPAFSELLGQAPAFANVLRAARLIAPTEVTVLLLGASGTGKELLARALHAASPRCRGPFHAINCAALPETLAEAELFGHAKGAFTGADVQRPGWLRASHGGTLLLDEVGDLPLPMQAKLLRFLENGDIQPLGQQGVCRVDVRVIAATHVDLALLVQQRKFRQDLFFRLNVVPLELPPLSARRGDIEPLLATFMARHAARHQRPQPRISAAAVACLQRYDWPGNVRELKNLAERLVVLQGGGAVLPEHLPVEMHAVTNALPLAMFSAPGQFVLPDAGLSLEALEQHLIVQALRKSGG
ncbi:MAG: sigma 54-interacting transcriptional regulator, partial [Magnetococcales bacterium]|nr:sigma 54-interacting transcriptional regulator [Magnetococcales bacterium]